MWVFARESLPNLPPGENELPNKEDIYYENSPSKHYVEFERQAGSKSFSYVAFNSQRPYPTLSDFGISDCNTVQEPDCKKARLCTASLDATETDNHKERNSKKARDLASYVTKEEIEPEDKILMLPSMNEQYRIYVNHQHASRLAREHIAKAFKEYMAELSVLDEEEMLKAVERDAELIENEFYALTPDLPVFNFEIN